MLSYYHKPIRITWLVLIISLFVTQTFTWRLYLREKAIEKDRVERRAIQFKSRLQSILEHSSTATYTLAFLVENGFLGDNFDSLSSQILKHNHYIDALQLVEGTVITKTYPLEGNEVVIGMDISQNPDHKREAAEAIKRRELYFEGPFELTQGGTGFVGRLPIIKENEVFGFAAVIIHLETILKGLSIDLSGEDENYIFQLIKNRGENKQKLFVNEETFDEGLYAMEHLSQGGWDLFVKLKSPEIYIQVVVFSLLGIVFTGFLTVFTWKISSQPIKLQKMINIKTRDLKKLNRKLERRAEELEQFAHVISHDLQEPTRMISSYLGLLKKQYEEKLDVVAAEYIHYSMRGAKRINMLIQDLLKYTLAGKEKENCESVPLRMIMDDVYSVLHREIEESGAEITYGELPNICANKIAMTQVMQNLVSNAIKYHRTNQKPKVSISAQETETHWQVSVKDNGIGIPKEYHVDIFSLFKRLHVEAEYQGTGLGLAIVKKNIQTMHGKIWVTSVENEGSEFHISLPKNC